MDHSNNKPPIQEPVVLATQKSFTEVVQRFRFIADTGYRGKLYDNVLSIFEDMTLDDRKAFLRGVLSLQIMFTSNAVQSQYICDNGVYIPGVSAAPVTTIFVPANTVEPVPDAVQDNIKNYNDRALVGMKTWTYKFSLITVVIATFFIVYTNVHYSHPENIRMLETFGNLGKIVSMFFKV